MITPSQVPFSSHNKLTALLEALHFALVARVRELWADLFDFEVPEGYEDETGFHYARVPVRAASRPPMDGPVWLGEDI